MAKKNKSSFRDKVSHNSRTQKIQGSAYGYLQIPKGLTVFKEAPSTRINLDFLPYVVTAKKHLDRDDSLEIAMPGGLWYKRPFFIHRNIGNETVVCPTSIGKKCPVCEYRSKKMKELADKEETDALKLSRRNLYCVIPIGHKEYEEKPHIWDISQFLFQEMLNDEIDDDPELGLFPDLEEGLTLKIRFGSAVIDKSKPFATTSRIDFNKREEGYGEKIMKQVPDLDECLLIHPYAKLEAMFLELEDAEDAEEDSEIEKGSGAGEEKEGIVITTGEACIACEGTGENSKGNPCRICDGTGIKPKQKEEEEKPEENKKEDRKKKEVKAPKEEKENSCPYDHVFGTDCEKYEHCDDCDCWDACIDAQEEKEQGEGDISF